MVREKARQLHLGNDLSTQKDTEVWRWMSWPHRSSPVLELQNLFANENVRFFFSSIKWCMMVWVYSPLSPPPLCIWLKSKIKSAEAMERKIFSGSDEVSVIQGKRRKRGSKKENSGLGGTSWSRLGKRVGGWGKRQMWLNYEGHHFALISRHKGYTSSLLLKRIYSS